MIRPADITLENYSSYPDKLLDFHLTNVKPKKDKFRKLISIQKARKRQDFQSRAIIKRRRRKRLRNYSMRNNDFDYLNLLHKDKFTSPEAPYKGEKTSRLINSFGSTGIVETLLTSFANGMV